MLVEQCGSFEEMTLLFNAAWYIDSVELALVIEVTLEITFLTFRAVLLAS